VTGETGPTGVTGETGPTGATGPPGAASQVLMFGNQNGNAGAGNSCLAYANAEQGNACVAVITEFATSANSLMFGPMPTDATISHLLAVTANSAADQIVTVLDNLDPTPLTCTTTAASLESCSDDTHSVVILAGHFLQVRVTDGGGSWRVTFQLR
jgi:hypothetical protein